MSTLTATFEKLLPKLSEDELVQCEYSFSRIDESEATTQLLRAELGGLIANLSAVYLDENETE